MGMPAGPPYAPTTASLGGVPNKSVDIAVCAVFLALYIGGGAGHMTIFQLNRIQGHKFIPSAAIFGFCMSRIVANSLRIALACHPTNVSLAIATQIFVAAGVLLLFVFNILFAQRLVRAFHPRVGWSRIFSGFFKVQYVLIVITLIMVITVLVQSFYTLSPNTRRIDRDVLFYGQAYFVFFSFLPFPLLAYALLASRKDGKEIDHFGRGSWMARYLIVAVSGVLLCLGASWRAVTIYESPHPSAQAPWYDSKGAFYTVDFTVEIIVVYFWLLVRIDQRFWVPDGSSKVRHYNGPHPEKVSGDSFSDTA
jgi:hypothetical protein